MLTSAEWMVACPIFFIAVFLTHQDSNQSSLIFIDDFDHEYDHLLKISNPKGNADVNNFVVLLDDQPQSKTFPPTSSFDKIKAIINDRYFVSRESHASFDTEIGLVNASLLFAQSKPYSND